MIWNFIIYSDNSEINFDSISISKLYSWRKLRTKFGMKRMKEGYYYLVKVALTPAKTGNTVKQ